MVREADLDNIFILFLDNFLFINLSEEEKQEGTTYSNNVPIFKSIKTYILFIRSNLND